MIELTLPPEPRLITKGTWDAVTSWEFFLDKCVPPPELCTSVGCLAIVGDSHEVVLTRNKRGWELPTGHIEPGETLDDTLCRECLEEGGFIPDEYQPFGYRKMTSTEPVPHHQRSGFYPHPHGYIPHFLTVVDQPLARPTGSEILEARAFPVDDLPEDIGKDTEAIIIAGLKAYTGTSY